MELLGYIASIFVGLLLGLIGGGGSILTVPILVYLFGFGMVQATAMSLFIVGTTALYGAYGYWQKGLIDVRMAMDFGIPSIISVYITRMFIVPTIPENLGTLAGHIITKPNLLLVLFALLMVAASVSMIRKSRPKLASDADSTKELNVPLVILEGAVVGLLTGLVGAGGGFLIIPALVVLGRLEMKMAVGTSLLIIATKSLIGFTGDLANMNFDFRFLLTIVALALVGMFVGQKLSDRVSSERLKPIFGWFVLITGISILIKEILT